MRQERGQREVDTAWRRRPSDISTCLVLYKSKRTLNLGNLRSVKLAPRNGKFLQNLYGIRLSTIYLYLSIANRFVSISEERILNKQNN